MSARQRPHFFVKFMKIIFQTLKGHWNSGILRFCFVLYLFGIFEFFFEIFQLFGTSEKQERVIFERRDLAIVISEKLIRKFRIINSIKLLGFHFHTMNFKKNHGVNALTRYLFCWSVMIGTVIMSDNKPNIGSRQIFWKVTRKVWRAGGHFEKLKICLGPSGTFPPGQVGQAGAAPIIQEPTDT